MDVGAGASTRAVTRSSRVCRSLPKIGDRRMHECALPLFYSETSSFSMRQHFVQCFEMSFFRVSCNQNVIKICYDSLDALQQALYHPLENSRGRGNPEWQLPITKEPLICVYDHKFTGLCFQRKLLVGMAEIQRQKIFPLAQLCEKVAYFWNWVSIQFRHWIYCHAKVTADPDS